MKKKTSEINGEISIYSANSIRENNSGKNVMLSPDIIHPDKFQII